MPRHLIQMFRQLRGNLPIASYIVLCALAITSAQSGGYESTRGSSTDAVFAETEATTSFPYPSPPWLPGTDFQIIWFAVPTPGVTAADDMVKDPNIHYLGITTVAIIRYSTSLWGPYDLLITTAVSRIKDGPPVFRIMQLYSSAVAPTLISNPLQSPGELARFEWKTQISGALDLKVFSPPNATTPVAELTGIYKLPVGVPITNTTLLGPLADEFFSIYQTNRTITSEYVKSSFSFSTSATLGI
eukprot:jgi/Botrbrau1/4661/Bobra.33_2s0032.1